MTADDALKLLKTQFIHTETGRQALEIVETEYRALKEFREHWQASVERACKSPKVFIEYDI